MEINTIYKGKINNRLFEIVDIYKHDGNDYLKVKVLQRQKNEMEFIEVTLNYFNRLSLLP